ncbi:hypothetical protein KI387_003241, partial [Taxus chinensis]
KWEGHNRELHLQEEIHTVVLNLTTKKLIDLNIEEDMQEINKRKVINDLVGAIVIIPLNIPNSPFARGIK